MNTVLVDEPQPGVRRLTLNRPDRLNAITRELVDDVHAALDDVAADSSCRVVVLTGAGRGFCAGADLKEGFGTGAEPGPHQVPELLRGQYRLGELIGRMRSLRVPLVAAVNGAAAGGGFAFCLACDVRVASTAARFLVANVKVGLSGGEMGISYLLPRIVGGGRASELMFTGRTVDAAEALAMGLVTTVVEAVDLEAASLAVAGTIASHSPLGAWFTKELVAHAADAPSLDAALALENRSQVLGFLTGNVFEAAAAFTEGRPPRFEV